MSVNATAAVPIPSAWNYRHLAAALFVGFILQTLVLPCLCFIGTAKMTFAVGFDLLVLARTLFAYRRRETGRGWIFYAMLCYTSAGWIEGITYLVLRKT
ncbi:MAG: hypothetical protein HZA31_11485 [Opitutae bacterium]|nr:hypothetical protein [Opitutae bacterium]